MKKFIALFFTLLVFGCMFCSCSQNKIESNIVYEIGSYDYISDADHKNELTLENIFEKDTKLLKNRKITVNDQKYEVTYKQTEKGYLYNGEIDIYTGNNVTIGINTATNDIVLYSYFDKNYLDNPDLTEKSREECLQIAEEYLATYTSDVENYVLTFEKLSPTEHFKGRYQLVYTRYIGDMPTSDTAQILITVYGDVTGHRFDCLGGFKNAKVPDESELSEIRSKVDDKLATIYSNVEDDYKIVHGEKEETLIRLKNGRYAIEYCVNTDLIDSNGEAFSEPSRFIVYLD